MFANSEPGLMFQCEDIMPWKEKTNIMNLTRTAVHTGVSHGNKNCTKINDF